MKTEFNVLLNTVDKVKSFVQTISKIDADIRLESGRYVVDAKSIMGIFSLNLTNPMLLKANKPIDISSIQEFVV